MNNKAMVMFAVAIGFGLVAMVGAQQLLSNGSDQPGIEKVQVLFTKIDVDPGTMLDESMVGFKMMPVDSISDQAITTKEDYLERAPKIALYKDQMVLKTQLGGKGESGVSMTIPLGMCVQTVGVNATMTHSGMMKPGDRVDVGVVYKVSHPKLGQIARTRVLLRHTQVYATDNVRLGADRANSGDMQAKNISLLVFPNQANLLKLAESKGTLHLTLRNRSDNADAPSGDISEQDIEKIVSDISEESAPATQVARTPPAAPKQPAPQQPPFGQYLQQQKPAPVATPVEKTEQWTVQIYNMEDKREFSFDLPKKETPPVATQTVSIEGANSKDSPGAATSLLKTFSQLMSGGRSKANRNAPANNEPAASEKPESNPSQEPRGESPATNNKLGSAGRDVPVFAKNPDNY